MTEPLKVTNWLYNAEPEATHGDTTPYELDPLTWIALDENGDNATEFDITLAAPRYRLYLGPTDGVAPYFHAYGNRTGFDSEQVLPAGEYVQILHLAWKDPSPWSLSRPEGVAPTDPAISGIEVGETFNPAKPADYKTNTYNANNYVATELTVTRNLSAWAVALYATDRDTNLSTSWLLKAALVRKEEYDAATAAGLPMQSFAYGGDSTPTSYWDDWVWQGTRMRSVSVGTASRYTAPAGTWLDPATVGDAGPEPDPEPEPDPSIVTVTGGQWSGRVGDAVAIDLVGTTDHEPDTLTWTATPLPRGVTLAGATLTGTPKDDGDLQTILTATDLTGQSATGVIDWTIEHKLTVVTVTLNEWTGEVGDQVSFYIQGKTTHQPRDLTWTVEGLPPGVEWDTTPLLYVYGNPTEPGYTEAIATATDLTGQQGTGVVAFTVEPAPEPDPSIVTVENLTYEAETGDTVALELIGATDHEPDTLTWTAEPLPVGLFLSGATITGALIVAEGDLQTILTATDETGQSATGVIDWTITAEPDPDPDPDPEPEPDMSVVEDIAATVAAHLDLKDDAEIIELAKTHVPAVMAFVYGYTRGEGFSKQGKPDPALSHVIVTSTARMTANPEQFEHFKAGQFSIRPSSLDGWTLPELALLNGYRVRWN